MLTTHQFIVDYSEYKPSARAEEIGHPAVRIAGKESLRLRDGLVARVKQTGPGAPARA
jgi:hypothetical protein